MATSEEVERFKSEINACLALNMKSLVSRPEWGTITFEESKEDFERLEALLQSLNLLPLEHIPQGIIPSFTSALQPVTQVLGEISKFSVETNNPTGVRQTYTNQLRDHVKKFFMVSHIYVPYLAYQRGDVERNIRQLNETVTAAEQTVQKSKDEIQNRRTEIEAIVASAREAAAKAGVAHFRDDFQEEAKAQEDAADIWLVRTTWLAVTTLLAAIILSGLGIFFPYPVERIAQVIASKVLIILILGTATLWCGKMYKAAKHLATTNKHRANALLTFQAFIQATEDEATKNAVLLETTRSIFAITNSGLIDGYDGGGSDGGGLRILEVIKNMGGAK
jgi:hypothetical protein